MAVGALDMYSSFCEVKLKIYFSTHLITSKEYLCIPCIKGRKSPSERFAGAEDTYTIEAMMQVSITFDFTKSLTKRKKNL
jgi:prolyl-tRNA synthetase